MRVLIVVGEAALGGVWSNHLERQGHLVHVVASQEEAIDLLSTQDVDILILDIDIDNGSAIAIADFSSYRRPEARVIFITRGRFFSDGSIFMHSPNACAMVPAQTNAEDLGALVQHYGTH